MTGTPDPDDAAEQARAALRAALAAAAERALASGATPEELSRYVEQRLGMLRSMLDQHPTDGRTESSARPDAVREDLPDHRDDAG